MFPVADGDTGSESSTFTMHAIIEEARLEDSAKKTMGNHCRSWLSARGNSGIIFAQFINGLYMGLER